MIYVLVENKTTVILGPIEWRQRFIQSELNDLDIDFNLSPSEPNSYLKINDEYGIYPVLDFITPDYDPLYEQLAGPFWTFDTLVAIPSFNVIDRNIDQVRGDLRGQVAQERYRRENLGTKVNIQGQEVTVDTSRQNRNTLPQAFLLMSETDTLNWKFPEGFVNLTYTDIEAVVRAGALYIQEQFDWEVTKNTELDTCVTKEQLQSVEIAPPVYRPGI